MELSIMTMHQQNYSCWTVLYHCIATIRKGNSRASYSQLPSLRSLFTNELAEDAHGANEEGPDFVNLHGTKIW